MEEQRENDRMVEQLTQRQAELAQSDNQIQLLEHHSVQAAEEIEVSHCHLTLGIQFVVFLYHDLLVLLLPAGSAAGRTAGIGFTHGPIFGFFAPQG